MEGIGPAQAVHVGPGQGDLVAFGEGEQQLGLQRALQVQVQFGLGQGVDPGVHEVALVKAEGTGPTGADAVRQQPCGAGGRRILRQIIGSMAARWIAGHGPAPQPRPRPSPAVGFAMGFLFLSSAAHSG
ncbi:hypothetical protein D3C78_1474080 [compost metagenome]